MDPAVGEHRGHVISMKKRLTDIGLSTENHLKTAWCSGRIGRWPRHALTGLSGGRGQPGRGSAHTVKTCHTHPIEEQLWIINMFDKMTIAYKRRWWRSAVVCQGWHKNPCGQMGSVVCFQSRYWPSCWVCKHRPSSGPREWRHCWQSLLIANRLTC